LNFDAGYPKKDKLFSLFGVATFHVVALLSNAYSSKEKNGKKKCESYGLLHQTTTYCI
jgi:hypothetical protein